ARAGVSNYLVFGTVYVGTNSLSNQIVVTNGAVVTNLGSMEIGSSVFGEFNSVAVAGPGSQWTTSGVLGVGNHGGHNRLAVTNGGWLVCQNFLVGLASEGYQNLLKVSDPGSSLICTLEGDVGVDGGGNGLEVSAGGLVVSPLVYLGSGLGTNNYA